MTPATAGSPALPRMRRPLLLAGRSLRCAKAHSFDLAKEGYAYLLPMQKKHAADPGRRQGHGSAPAARSCRQGTTPR